MDLISGGRSNLNPNAPLYVPAAVRKVEDFSPEWYELISTSTWYHDYWVSQREELNSMYSDKVASLNNNDIVDLLPDDIDLGIDENLSFLKSHFDAFAQPYVLQGNKSILTNDSGPSKNHGPSRILFPEGSKFATQPGRVPGKAN